MNKYDELVDSSVLNNAVKNLTDHGFLVEVVDTGSQALEKIKNIIPKDASVMNGSSTTLNQIGFVDYLKSGDHGWNNLHANILAETDKDKQAKMRKESVLSDFYLGSAHAVSETGEVLIASATGSQLPHLVFTSQNIILVVSTKKIAKDMNDAMNRISEHVVPLEDQRMKGVGYPGTVYSKLLVLKSEPAMMGRKFNIIFVKENLGF
jgi:L-lactate utilization protein LutC